MISIAFKSEFTFDDISKISIISEEDSFTYALFNNEESLVEAGRLQSDDFENFKNSYINKSKYYMSKSRIFAHVPADVVPQIDTNLYFKEMMPNENIYCYYHDDLIPQTNGTSQFKHFSTAINNRYRFKEEPVVYLHFNKQSMILCGTGSTGFKFYNQFDIENAEDILYFTKNLFTTLKYNEEQTKLIVSGYIDEGFVYFKTLQKYFYQVTFADSYDFKIKSEGKHHYFFDHYLNIG